MIWAIGASVVMIYNIAGYVRFKQKVRRTAVRVTDGHLLEVLQTCRQETHTRTSPALYTSTFVTSPILLGVLHPVIILPDCLSTESELRYALLHELTHARRCDGLVKWLAVLATSVHWFNPLVYAVQHELDRSCELACDEAVTMRFSADDRRGYGSMLLSVASAAGASSPAMFSAMVEDKRNLKERMGVIMSSRKQAGRTIAVSIVVAGLIAVVATLAGCTLSTKQTETMKQPAALSQIKMITTKIGWAVSTEDQIFHTTDSGSTWTDVSIFQAPLAAESLPTFGACFADGQSAYVAVTNGANHASPITIYHTADQGKNWDPVQLPIRADWERNDAAGLFVDFPDALHGYILVTGSPGVGQMAKALYKTDDGGKSYSFVGDVTGLTNEQGVRAGIEGYPTGMAFSSVATGFVTCSYRGPASPQIYKTTDGGSNWTLAYQHMPKAGEVYTLSFPTAQIPTGQIPNFIEGDGYVNAYSPLFIGTKRTDGMMLLDLVRGEVHVVRAYRTKDAGATWTAEEVMGNNDIHNYSFLDDKNGYGLDTKGIHFTTSDGGLHWTAVPLAKE
jgi:photosystem II stability/assembly factor-like uncharacterized protein